MHDSVSTSDLPDTVSRLIAEGPISISAAARLCGTFREGKPTHASTLTRWALKGFKLPDGRVVKLETYRLSGRLMTSPQALVRFIRAQNEPTVPASPLSATGETPRQRTRQQQSASAQLDVLLPRKGDSLATPKSD